MPKLTIKTGSMYSNGNFHHHWEVRHVLEQGIACEQAEKLAPECVKYKVLAGANRRRSFTCSSEEFLRWARYEVARDENSWFKVSGEADTPAPDTL